MIISIQSKKYGDQEIIIDDEDYNRIKKHTWYIDKKKNIFYAKATIRINNKRKNIRMHRYIMNARKNQKIDHINGNGLDNRKSVNLRFCTQMNNCRNSKKKNTNKSGFKGVSYYKSRNKYVAFICINYKNKHLGYYSTPEKAYAAYCEAAKKYHGNYANIG
jgi:hypothetical protein